MAMQIDFGIDVRRQRQGHLEHVVWNSGNIVNGHMLMVGMSGSGKTHTLRRMINQMKSSATEKLHFHVFDVHGDIVIDDASSVQFSEQTAYGLNPLRLNPDPHFGGVRKRIQSFLSIMGKTHTLGTKQEATIRNILQDLYEWRGFRINDARTWSEIPQQRTYPTLDDAYRVASHLLRTRFLGSNQNALKNLEQVNKKAQAVQRRLKNSQGCTSDDDREVEELETAKAKAIEAYAKYVSSISSGTEMNDILKYNSVDVLKSVVERLENVRAIGVFKDLPPPFDAEAPVWRYDLKALGRNEQIMFVLFRLQEMFDAARQRGEQDHIRDVIVLDEARIYADDDPDNPINTISTEGRKFGMALICASQSPTHFPENFVSSVATKIVLGIDEMYWDSTTRKMGISREQLRWVTPRKSCVIQIKQPGQTRSDWRGAILP